MKKNSTGETLKEARAHDLKVARMAELRRAIDARADAQNTIDKLIPTLHKSSQVSWGALGREMSVSAQAVQKRYGKPRK